MIKKELQMPQSGTVFLNQLADKLTNKDSLGVGLGVGVGQGVEPRGCKKIRVRGLGSVGEERERKGGGLREVRKRGHGGGRRGPPKKQSGFETQDLLV